MVEEAAGQDPGETPAGSSEQSKPLSSRLSALFHLLPELSASSQGGLGSPLGSSPPSPQLSDSVPSALRTYSGHESDQAEQGQEGLRHDPWDLGDSPRCGALEVSRHPSKHISPAEMWQRPWNPEAIKTGHSSGSTWRAQGLCEVQLHHIHGCWPLSWLRAFKEEPGTSSQPWKSLPYRLDGTLSQSLLRHGKSCSRANTSHGCWPCDQSPALCLFHWLLRSLPGSEEAAQRAVPPASGPASSFCLFFLLPWLLLSRNGTSSFQPWAHIDPSGSSASVALPDPRSPSSRTITNCW